MFAILSALPLALSITFSVINIYPEKLRAKGIAILTLIDYAMVLLLHIAHKDRISGILIIISVFLYTYIVSKKFGRAMITAFAANIILAASDAITGFLSIDVLNLKYTQVTNNFRLYFVMDIIILIVSYALSKIIRIIINKVYDRNSTFKDYLKENTIAILYTIFGLIAINAYFILDKNMDSFFGRFNTLINMLLILGFLCMSVLLIYSSSRNIRNKLLQEYKEKEYEQLKEYTNKIENMDSDLRRFKHDYINILQTLGGYIAAGDVDGLKKFYYDDLLKESNQIIEKDRYLSLLKHIKLDPIKALISSKIINAYSYEIDTQIEISDDINKLSISTLDICRILGILIDNAVEAAALCDKKNMRIGIIRNDDSTIFIISNSCLDNTPPVYKIFEENFSTKGVGRGIGLNTVRQIINEKYHNVTLNTKIKDGIFTQELIILD